MKLSKLSFRTAGLPEGIKTNSFVELILEETKQKEETKMQYLQQILGTGFRNAMLLKCAYRISNLTDLHRDTHTEEKISDYLNQTEQFVIQLARKLKKVMDAELANLVARRREI